jgi:hypothetical protein
MGIARAAIAELTFFSRFIIASEFPLPGKNP